MLWLQLAILVLVACVQGGGAQDGSAATGCRLKCSQKGGKCVDSPRDCSGRLISDMKCAAEGATCNCCLGEGKGGKVGRKIKTPSANRKGDSSQKSKKKTKKIEVSNKDGSSKTESDKGKSDGKVKKDKKKKKKTSSANRKGDSSQKSKKKTKKIEASNKDGSSTKKDGPKKSSKKQKKGKGKKNGSGKIKKERKGKKNGSGKKQTKGLKDTDDIKCDITCGNGKCVKNEMRCDKVNDCGADDDADEQGCNFVPKLTCHRCKTWDTGDVGAKFDSSCGTTGYSDLTDKADTVDPYIGCATKVYKNGDVVRLFQSWQIDDTQGNCYEGTDYENGGPEYQYTRCWCSDENCNTNLCEECGAAPAK